MRELNVKLSKSVPFSKNLLLIITLIMNPFGLTFGQEVDFKTAFADAEYYFLFNDFKEALPLYKKAHDFDPENNNVNYRIGRCYLCIPGVKHQAIHYLEKAVNSISLTYQEGSYKEKSAPLNAHFYLGEAYRINGQFDDAIRSYNIFKSLLDPKDTYSFDFVNQQIKACERASASLKTPSQVSREVISLFPTDKYIQGVAMSYDSKTLLFTVNEKFYNAVFVSTKETNGAWGVPENITLNLAVEGELYTTALNNDGTELFFYKYENGIGNIYSSKKVSGTWQKAQKLGRPINSRSWETSASLSPDGKILLFSSNRKGGQGGIDLYYSTQLPDGSWSEAINMGATINTPYNEEAPHLSPDGTRLFFISQGHNSLGGYDVFFADRIGDNEWSTPTNMGYPISTADDDMWFFPICNDAGLVTSVERNKPEVSNIYTITMASDHQKSEVTINGELQLANGFEVQGNQFSIYLIDANTKDTLTLTNPESITGQFVLNTKPGAYRVLVNGKGYTAASIPLVIPSSHTKDSYPINVKLTPVEVTSGKYITVKSILFDYNSDSLNNEALPELYKLASILKEYPTVSVEICGHTDNKGSLEYNQKLSLQRATSVIKFLHVQGVNEERLAARGAGIYECIASNVNADGTDNPAGRRLNRRASIRVINSEENIDIANEIEVPEHLRPREQKYTILLAPINTQVDYDKLNAINSNAGIQYGRLAGRNNRFAYSIGTFENKSKAIALLNLAIDNGFPNAAIVGEDDLNQLIER